MRSNGWQTQTFDELIRSGILILSDGPLFLRAGHVSDSHIGCIRGRIPFQNSKETLAEQAQILLEQRRLFYVVITRCTEILLLSSALRLQRDFAFQIGAQVQGFGNPVRAVTSQFIAELGPDAPQPRLGAEWKAAGFV